jgi:hypothetical protein
MARREPSRGKDRRPQPGVSQAVDAKGASTAVALTPGGPARTAEPPRSRGEECHAKERKPSRRVTCVREILQAVPAVHIMASQAVLLMPHESAGDVPSPSNHWWERRANDTIRKAPVARHR